MRTKADISGHMRTNADSAKFPFRNFATRKSNLLKGDKRWQIVTKGDSAKFAFRNFAAWKRRWKWQTTSAQWPGCFCRKMCRSNTCKKLRKCAENNLRPQIYQNTDEQLFSARSAIFCCHWGSTFSGQVSAIEARDEAIFTKIKPLLYRYEKEAIDRKVTQSDIDWHKLTVTNFLFVTLQREKASFRKPTKTDKNWQKSTKPDNDKSSFRNFAP